MILNNCLDRKCSISFPDIIESKRYFTDRHNMLTRCKLIMVLLLIQASLSDAVNNPCEIPSVEARDDATFTIRFGEDVSNDEMDFNLNFQPRVKRPGLYDQRMLQCAFNFGNVACRNTGCCTWERQVKDVFRVYIHNVSLEHEGEYWVILFPPTTTVMVPCNFTLKVSNLQQATSGLPTPYFFTSSFPNDQTTDFSTTGSNLHQAISSLSTPDFFTSSHSIDQTTDFSTTVSTVHQDNSRLSTQDFFASSNSNDPKKDFSTTVSNLHQAISSLSTPDFFTSSNSIDQTTDFSTTVSTLYQDNSRLSTPDFFTSSNSNDTTKDFSTTVTTLHQANSRLSTLDFFTSSISNDQTKYFSTTEKRNGTSIIKVLGSVIALLVTVALVSFNY